MKVNEGDLVVQIKVDAKALREKTKRQLFKEFRYTAERLFRDEMKRRGKA